MAVEKARDRYQIFSPMLYLILHLLALLSKFMMQDLGFVGIAHIVD